MNIYPFAGEIKMEKVIKDGKEVIEWERVDLTYHGDGNVGIGTPPDASAPRVMGEPVERLRVSMTDGVGITPEQSAALVAAAEREKLAAWMMAQGYSTGHGDNIEDLLKELEWQIEDRIKNIIRAKTYAMQNDLAESVEPDSEADI